MTELLYFSFSDLMVRVEYGKEANSLRYSSHRKLSFGERVIVEQYLLTNVAVKTEYYKRHPALLVYAGIDAKLIRELNLFHLKNTLKSLADKEKVVNESVSELIHSSLSQYYFDRIGDIIVDLRRGIQRGCPEVELNQHRRQLEELVKCVQSARAAPGHAGPGVTNRTSCLSRECKRAQIAAIPGKGVSTTKWRKAP